MKQVVCGVDIGSWTFKICVSDWKNFQIITNQANFRETPSLISFTQSQRLIGQQAMNKMKSNYMNTIRAPMRLIGLQKSEQLIEQQMRGATSRFQIGDEFYFYITGEEKNIRVQPQQLLIGLMGKIKKILLSHQMKAQHFYITVPAYLSQYQRKIIKKCGEIAQVGSQVKIIDDWMSIASQYSFQRVKQLKALTHPRIILFIDIGYSKTSLFVYQFNQKECKLLDCEHLRFIGSKNMDFLIAQFYDEHYKRSTSSTSSLFSMKKSMVKLNDHIQSQRKVLSANPDHHLNVESIHQDKDLSYNMKRSEFQSIVYPIFEKIAQGFKTIKNRIPQKINLHSIQLIGGASRIPYFKKMVSDIFGIEASKTLNQSEAMAHGTTIYGTKDSGLFYYDYQVPNINLVDICVCWNFTKGNYLGQFENLYKNKQIIFSANQRVPSENIISFGNEGPVEMYIYYGHRISRKTIGYLRFQTPNKIRFFLDSNKIVTAKLDISNFETQKFYDKKEDKWFELKLKQQELIRHEERLKKIHELKNEYEAKIYATKNKISEYQQVMSEAELQSIGNELKNIQQWIQSQHDRSLGSQEDIALYQYKLSQINSISLFDCLETRKQNIFSLIKKYELVMKAIQQASRSVDNDKRNRKFHFLKIWLLQSFEKMKQTQWEGYYLTESSLDFASAEIKNIMKM